MRLDLTERVVRLGDVEILVKEARVEMGECTRYTAELSLHGGHERAAVDATVADDYAAVLTAALQAFAASVRLRRVLP